MVLFTAADAAERLGVPRSTVASWADPRPNRGWIDKHGERQRLTVIDHGGPRRAARYDWDQLLEAEQATRRSEYSSRSKRRELIPA